MEVLLAMQELRFQTKNCKTPFPCDITLNIPGYGIAPLRVNGGDIDEVDNRSENDGKDEKKSILHQNICQRLNAPKKRHDIEEALKEKEKARLERENAKSEQKIVTVSGDVTDGTDLQWGTPLAGSKFKSFRKLIESDVHVEVWKLPGAVASSSSTDKENTEPDGEAKENTKPNGKDKKNTKPNGEDKENTKPNAQTTDADATGVEDRAAANGPEKKDRVLFGADVPQLSPEGSGSADALQSANPDAVQSASPEVPNGASPDGPTSSDFVFNASTSGVDSPPQARGTKPSVPFIEAEKPKRTLVENNSVEAEKPTITCLEAAKPLVEASKSPIKECICVTDWSLTELGVLQEYEITRFELEIHCPEVTGYITLDLCWYWKPATSCGRIGFGVGKKSNFCGEARKEARKNFYATSSRPTSKSSSKTSAVSNADAKASRYRQSDEELSPTNKDRVKFAQKRPIACEVVRKGMARDDFEDRRPKSAKNRRDAPFLTNNAEDLGEYMEFNKNEEKERDERKAPDICGDGTNYTPPSVLGKIRFSSATLELLEYKCNKSIYDLQMKGRPKTIKVAEKVSKNTMKGRPENTVISRASNSPAHSYRSQLHGHGVERGSSLGGSGGQAPANSPAELMMSSERGMSPASQGVDSNRLNPYHHPNPNQPYYAIGNQGQLVKPAQVTVYRKRAERNYVSRKELERQEKERRREAMLKVLRRGVVDMKCGLFKWKEIQEKRDQKDGVIQTDFPVWEPPEEEEFTIRMRKNKERAEMLRIKIQKQREEDEKKRLENLTLEERTIKAAAEWCRDKDERLKFKYEFGKSLGTGWINRKDQEKQEENILFW